MSFWDVKAFQTGPMNARTKFKNSSLIDKLAIACAMASLAMYELSLRFLRVQTLKHLARWQSSATRALSFRKLPAATIIERYDLAKKLNPVVIECFAESLALWTSLRKNGHPAELKLGCRTILGSLEAHAWVELDGRVVSDVGGDHNSWQPFDRPLLRADD